MKNWRLIAVVALVALAIGGYLFNKYRVAPDLTLSELTLTDLQGNPVSLELYADKNIFLNFFATWCGPCMAELPSLQNAIAKLRADGFVMILVSDEPSKRLLQLSDALEGEVIVLRSEKKLQAYNVYTIPTSYILAKQNKVVYQYVGVDDWASDEVLGKLRDLVK